MLAPWLTLGGLTSRERSAPPRLGVVLLDLVLALSLLSLVLILLLGSFQGIRTADRELRSILDETGEWNRLITLVESDLQAARSIARGSPDVLELVRSSEDSRGKPSARAPLHVRYERDPEAGRLRRRVEDAGRLLEGMILAVPWTIRFELLDTLDDSEAERNSDVVRAVRIRADDSSVRAMPQREFVVYLVVPVPISGDSGRW